MISAIGLHLLAGLVAGSIFGVRTLLTLVGFVLVGCIGATVLRGVSAGVVWSIGSLVAVQAGYLGGIYVRSVLEHAGIAVPHVQPRRHS